MIKAGIIGFGKMGALHARGYTNSGIEISGIMDEHAPENEYPNFTCIDEFLANVDMVSICTPSITHKDIVLKCVKAGKPVLVEKPLAMNTKDCEEIIACAKKYNVKISVGHIERYNAGFKALLENLDKIGSVKSVSAVRTNPSSNRITDVDVLADLTVHDLDLIRTICGGDRLENIVVSNTKYNADLGFLDSVQARFNLNEISVKIYTCRVAKNAERTIEVIGEKGTIIANLATRSASLNGEEILIEGVDQINMQLKSWSDSVSQNTNPVVSMYDGLFAVSASDCIRSAT